MGHNWYKYYCCAVLFIFSLKGMMEPVKGILRKHDKEYKEKTVRFKDIISEHSGKGFIPELSLDIYFEIEDQCFKTKKFSEDIIKQAKDGMNNVRSLVLSSIENPQILKIKRKCRFSQTVKSGCFIVKLIKLLSKDCLKMGIDPDLLKGYKLGEDSKEQIRHIICEVKEIKDMFEIGEYYPDSYSGLSRELAKELNYIPFKRYKKYSKSKSLGLGIVSERRNLIVKKNKKIEEEKVDTCCCDCFKKYLRFISFGCIK